MILKNHASVPGRKKKLSQPNKGRREVSRNKLVEKSGMPDKVKILGKFDSSTVRPIVQLKFV